MARTPITEDQDIHKQWYDVKPTTPDELATFVKMLLTEYNHDYGTICHAAAAAAVAACHTVNADPTQGGITGFQAGAIMWEFVRHWLHIEGPTRLLQYDDMVYPHSFLEYRTIPKSVFERLQGRAKRLLEERPEAHPDNVAHWHSIIRGEVPFGYQLEEEEDGES